MSYLGKHPTQTDRTTSGTFQVNELVERQKRGMHPSSSNWDLISYVNTRDGDSNIADAYDFTLPDYDVFFFDLAESNFQTGTSQSAAEPRFQISEDNGSSFISSNYATQRTYGSQSSSVQNSGFASADGIRLTVNAYHVTVPTFAAYAYIFNAKTNGKRTTIVGKAQYKDTSALGAWSEFFGNNSSTNVSTDLRFYTSDIGQTNAQITLVASLYGCKNYGK